MARIIDGKSIAAAIRADLKKEAAECAVRYGRAPGIAVILAGDDPASAVYVGSKEKAAEEIGYYSVVERVSSDVSTERVLELVEKFNSDPAIDGILVQLPLPAKVDEKKVLRAIKPAKDVDGFHPVNVGLLNIGEDSLVPCTPRGIMTMLDVCGIDPSGKKAVVIGRSNIVGKPMAALLLKANATVTVCHSKTEGLEGLCAAADILVAAIGRPGFVKGSFIKDGAVVIDVGMNRVEGKLCGDVDFEEAAKRASFITPVPGGVGPMTIATLMQNTMKAFKQLR